MPYDKSKVRCGVVSCTLSARDWELFNSDSEGAREAAVVLNRAVEQYSRECKTAREFMDAMMRVQCALQGTGASDSEATWVLEFIAKDCYGRA